MDSDKQKIVLDNLLAWFRNSGIMMPENGFWGVAERLFVNGDDSMRSVVLDSFNSYTMYEGCDAVESRRPDCNFQTALLFLLSSEIYGRKEDYLVARNILDFLYFRSGLLNRKGECGAPADVTGAWNWSHICWCARLWMDDNAWSLAIPLMIAARCPELDERYGLRKHAVPLAENLAAGFIRTFRIARDRNIMEDMTDPEKIWFGRPLLPHWGSLVCFALAVAAAYGVADKEKTAALVKEYHEYLLTACLNASELSYALIGASACAKVFDDEIYPELIRKCSALLAAKIDPVTGNIPSEHYEAPSGPALVDTIYTANWALLGMQTAASVLPDNGTCIKSMNTLMELFSRIQDVTPDGHFRGCWRGMFDMEAGTWGGGNRYEGGAGSIYSGWTNAPVGLVFAYAILGSSLIGK